MSKDNPNKSRKNKRRNMIIRRVLVLGLVLWLGKTYIGQAMMIKDLEAQKVLEEKNIIALKRDIRNLESEIGKKDSLEFVEKVAREDYGMVKPREIIYIDNNKKNSKKNFLVPGTK